MTNLVSRLQTTRDKIYSLSDRFGIVGHCNAVLTHRITGVLFTVAPRPKLLEPTSRDLYRFNMSQSVEVNKEDKMLMGISRAGFVAGDFIFNGAVVRINTKPHSIL